MLAQRALLASTPEGRCAYIPADLRNPEKILADPATRETLDFGRPIALFIVAILHFIPDEEEPRSIVRTLVDALPSGSYVIATTHGSSQYNPQETGDNVGRAYNRGGVNTADRDASEFGTLVFSGPKIMTKRYRTGCWCHLRPDVRAVGDRTKEASRYPL